MKVHENAEVMKVILDKRAFTKHGQHMKAMGKTTDGKKNSRGHTTYIKGV